MKPAMSKLDRKSLFQVSLAAILVIVFSLFIHDSGATLFRVGRIAGKALFLPLFLAIVVSYILDPGVSILERKGLKRSYGVFLVYSLLVLFFGGITYFVFPFIFNEIVQLRLEFPRYLQTLLGLMASFEIFYNQDLGLFGTLNVTESISNYFEGSGATVFTNFVVLIKTCLTLLILVPLFSFFLLYDGRPLKRSFIQNVPNKYFESAMIVSYHVNKSLGNFIRGRFYESAIVGLIALMGLYFIGLKYFWLFALFIALTNLVPVLGPFVGILFTCGFSFLESGDPIFSILVLSILLFAQLIDNLILIPILIKQTSGLHVIAGIVAIIIGGQFFGVFGMILAVPVATIGKLIFREVWRHWGNHLEVQKSIKNTSMRFSGLIG